MDDRDRDDRRRWDRKYRDKGPESFGSEAAQWLVAHRHLLTAKPGGRALDVACGTGRNAVYLARLGFTVDALDVSGVAVTWLQERVERERLAVHPRCCDLTREPLPPHEYQVVLNFNFLQRDLLPALKEATAPGGLVVFETFTRLQAELPCGPSDPEHTLEAGELRRAFADFEILDYREATMFPEDAQKTRGVASLVARRPGRGGRTAGRDKPGTASTDRHAALKPKEEPLPALRSGASLEAHSFRRWNVPQSEKLFLSLSERLGPQRRPILPPPTRACRPRSPVLPRWPRSSGWQTPFLPVTGRLPWVATDVSSCTRCSARVAGRRFFLCLVPLPPVAADDSSCL